MATMAFTFMPGVAGKGLIILVHGADPPTDLEWATYVREFVKHDAKGQRNLAFTDGGAPSGAQRKQVNDFLKGRASPAVVVSASYMVRGVVTALSWFNPQVRAYAPEEATAGHALPRRARRGHAAGHRRGAGPPAEARLRQAQEQRRLRAPREPRRKP